jgi:hypothetical protein
MFAAIGGCLIRLYDSGDDVEYRISALIFTVDFLAFLESNNRRDNGQSSAFFIAKQLTHFLCWRSPRVNGANDRTVTVN